MRSWEVEKGLKSAFDKLPSTCSGPDLSNGRRVKVGPGVVPKKSDYAAARARRRPKTTGLCCGRDAECENKRMRMGEGKAEDPSSSVGLRRGKLGG